MSIFWRSTFLNGTLFLYRWGIFSERLIMNIHKSLLFVPTITRSSRVMEDTKTLFIGDLSVYCSEADVESLFGQFGPIDKITIKRSSAGNTNLSYGFIKFQKRESAESAIRMNGFMFLGRAMRWRLLHCNLLFVILSFFNVGLVGQDQDRLTSQSSPKKVLEGLIQRKFTLASYRNKLTI